MSHRFTHIVYLNLLLEYKHITMNNTYISILIIIVYVNTLPITSIQAALLHWFIEPEKPSLSKRLVSQ